MKKLLKIIICFIISLYIINYIPVSFTYASSISMPSITLIIDDTNFIIDNSKHKELKLTEYQKKEIDNYKLKIKQIHQMKGMGFESEEIVKYLYPYLYTKTIDIINNEEISPIDAYISVKENTAKIQINNEKNGVKLNKNTLFSKILYNLCNNLNNINVKKEINYPKIFVNDIIKCSKLRSMFETNFINSTNERKNNIRLALKSLDGVEIKPGEIFSFNNVVGERTEKRGYKSAKIISKGKFIEATGGGVCQVSTTLYNCALLAGLDIIEVHSHSLKIGYIEPGFDSMVNGGTSDLKFKNNTEYPIVIATSSMNDNCLISIYGIENEFIYKRYYESEEIKDLIEDTDSVIQLPSKAKTSLLIYDDNELIEERFLREVRYNPLIITKE